MQTIEILDIKAFMQLLFQTQILDDYDFVSSNIKTDMTYQIDGHFNKDFFTEEELLSFSADTPFYMPWSHAKEKVFQLIKGKKTPLQLKLVLKYSDKALHTLLEQTHSTLTEQDLDGLFVNILFQDNALSVICGVSYKIFTMEKSLEQEFTDSIKQIFIDNKITCK